MTDTIHTFARMVCRSRGGGAVLCYVVANWDRSRSAEDNLKAIPARLAWELWGSEGCWGMGPEEAVEAVAVQLAEYELWRQDAVPSEGYVL